MQRREKQNNNHAATWQCSKGEAAETQGNKICIKEPDGSKRPEFLEISR